MQNKIFRFGPIALSTTLTTNLLNPPAATGGVNGGASPQYIILKHIRVVNKTATAANFSLWLGATGTNAAGAEVIASQQVVQPRQSFDWYGQLRIDAADFLVGGAGTATALTIQGEGEIGVAG
jgi:hypothetical protein